VRAGSSARGSGSGARSWTGLLRRAALRHGGMGRLQAVERALRRLALRTVRRKLHDGPPRFGGASEILLAARSDDPEVQQRLRVAGIELQGLRKLLEGFVRLVGVVVAHSEIGAHVRIVRSELHRFAVPLDRFVVSLGVEIQVPELGARLRVRWLAFGYRLECRHLRLVQYSGTAARRPVTRLWRRRLRRRGGLRARGRLLSLLSADHPSGNQTEENAGDAERNRLGFHG